MIAQSVIERWKSDLTSVKRGEEIRIVSGELNCDLYREIKQDLEAAIRDHGALFKVIAGPLISIEDETNSNAMLELAQDDLIELWVAPYRQLSHFQVYDSRCVFREDYHDPLATERKGTYFTDPLSVSGYSYKFDNTIGSLELKTFKQSPPLVTASKADLLMIKCASGFAYDFLNTEELERIAQKTGAQIKTFPSRRTN